MPHTNRKKRPSGGKVGADPKKKFAHSKREYISSDDGWTHVTDKRSNLMIRNEITHTVFGTALADMTLEEMVKEYERYKKHWETSGACAELKNILSDTKKERRYTVDNVICLALGSLQNLVMDWRRSSHTQLAALMTVKETLALKCQVIMQDPRFTDLDKSFLESMGCKVVDDPQAFEYVNKGSLVYAVHSAFQLLWKVKEKADPALLIVNDLRESRFEQINYRPDVPDDPADELLNSQRTEEKEKIYLQRYEQTCSLKQFCEEIAFPELRSDFSDTMIYWRYGESSMKSKEPVTIDNP